MSITGPTIIIKKRLFVDIKANNVNKNILKYLQNIKSYIPTGVSVIGCNWSEVQLYFTIPR